MIVGVVGCGTVGHAMVRAFMEWCEVRAYDQQWQKATHTLEQVMEAELVFVCLPTPQGVNGAADMSVVTSFLESQQGSETTLVLKSTVPIGTTKFLREKYKLPNLVHSPEFLTARCAVTDAMLPARNIVGGILDGFQHGMELLAGLYKHRFPGVPVWRMTSDESEAVKLFLNSFFAAKVAIFNELHTVATGLGMDWGRIINGVLSDGRIAHSHTKVPGPDGCFGFGGACLPKDLANLVNCAEQAGGFVPIMRAVMFRNQTDRERLP